MHKETAMFKTEAEAWEAIADTLEMIEEMPPRRDGSTTLGLCAVLGGMVHDGLITNSIYLTMSDRIERALGSATWLATAVKWKPRVTFARKFAEDARNSS